MKLKVIIPIILVIFCICLITIFVFFRGSPEIPKAIILDNLHLDELSPSGETIPFVNETRKLLEGVGVAVEYVGVEDVTLEVYQNLAKYNLVILRVHSGILVEDDDEKIVCFFSSEELSKQKFRKYNDWFEKKYLANATLELPNGTKKSFIGVKPNFIKNCLNGEFQDSIIIAMGCNSLESYSMARAFVDDRKALAYIGWTSDVTVNHTDSATLGLLKNFFENNETIEEARRAWQDYGIHVYAIAYGDEADISTMQEVAQAGNGEYYFADTLNIYDTYIRIAQEILKSYPVNPLLDVGNKGYTEWFYVGEFNGTENVNDFSNTLNNLIMNCNCPGCSIEGDNCTISWWVNATGVSGINHTFFVYANETSDMTTSNITGEWLVEIDDPESNPPNITTLTEVPDDPATYSSGSYYRFNSTVLDDTAISLVLFEFNGTNYSTSATGDIYNATVIDLGVGNYTYRWFANDTSGNINNTETGTYEVVPAAGQTSLVFDKSSPQTYGTTINASCTILEGEGEVVLYRDGVDVTATENGKDVTLAAGTYTYYCNMSATSNYTAASNYSDFTIDKAGCSIYTYLNNSRSNATILNNTEIWLNATMIAGDTGAIITLFNNGTVVANATSPLANLTGYNNTGWYNITSVYEATENYTRCYETWWVKVASGPDTTAPNITNLTEVPSDPATYSPTQVYEFNVTIKDENPLYIVLFEIGGVNYSTSSVGDIYNATITGLTAGNYTYYWFANDTYGNQNDSVNSTYTINSGSNSSCNLLERNILKLVIGFFALAVFGMVILFVYSSEDIDLTQMLIVFICLVIGAIFTSVIAEIVLSTCG